MFINVTVGKQIVMICGKVEDCTAIRMNKLLVHVTSRMNLTSNASNRKDTME